MAETMMREELEYVIADPDNYNRTKAAARTALAAIARAEAAERERDTFKGIMALARRVVELERSGSDYGWGEAFDELAKVVDAVGKGTGG